MNAFASWFTPEVLRTLGLALLHFLWQGAALAALAAAALSVSRRASTRYAINVLTLVSMTAAPVITFFVLSPSSAGHAAPAPAAFVQAAIPAVAHAIISVAQRTEAVSNSPALSGATLTMFVELWFIGVILFSLRTAGGFFLIARLRRRDSHPISAELLLLCREMQQRLGITRAIRYCESLHLDTPAVVGWFRPVVLLPESFLSLSSASQHGIACHELLHVLLVAFFNLFQVASETLLSLSSGGLVAQQTDSHRTRKLLRRCGAGSVRQSGRICARPRADGTVASRPFVCDGRESRSADFACGPPAGNHRKGKQLAQCRPSVRNTLFGVRARCRQCAVWISSHRFGACNAIATIDDEELQRKRNRHYCAPPDSPGEACLQNHSSSRSFADQSFARRSVTEGPVLH